MATMHLGPWQKQPYGVLASGYVEAKDRCVAIRVRSPHPDIHDSNVLKLINFNGITAGAESMRVTAQVAAGLGYAAVTLDYSNTTDYLTPLECNARDGLVVMDALDADEYSLLGLSMGGAVATLIAAQSERPITNLDLVSPGGYIDRVVGLDMHTISQAFQRESFDAMVLAMRYPYAAASIAMDCLANCSRRPAAVRAEADELLRETVYRHLVQLRREKPETVVTLAHGSHDKLVPRSEILASLRKHEADEGISLVDVEVPYHGTHSRLIYDARLAESVLLASAGVDSRMLAR